MPTRQPRETRSQAESTPERGVGMSTNTSVWEIKTWHWQGSQRLNQKKSDVPVLTVSSPWVSWSLLSSGSNVHTVLQNVLISNTGSGHRGMKSMFPNMLLECHLCVLTAEDSKGSETLPAGKSGNTFSPQDTIQLLMLSFSKYYPGTILNNKILKKEPKSIKTWNIFTKHSTIF